MLTLDFETLAAQVGAARVLGTVGRGRSCSAVTPSANWPATP